MSATYDDQPRQRVQGIEKTTTPQPVALAAGVKLAAIATMMMTVAGCTLITATPPSVSVMDVQLTALGLTEQQLAVTLCVTNPNASELAFRRVTADLDVSGLPLSTGRSDLAVRLPPASSTVVPFTVSTTVQNIGPQILGVFQAGGLDYRIHGTVTLEGAIGIALPYSRSGHLDLLADGARLASTSASTDASSCAVSTRTPLR